LDELNNQSEPTRGLASHKDVGVMKKLARIATGVFQVQDSHVWARSAMVPKKDKLIKVMIGLMKPMRDAT
jgi:hypothetical protein